MAWQIEKADFFISRFRKFEKKHPDEAVAVMDNLDTYFSTLQEVDNPFLVRGGFIHDEPDGIKAIDQKGAERKLMQTRLYIYPEIERHILHVINIGTKSDQKGDIKECRDYVRSLK